MLVFNISDQDVVYRGHKLSANGGCRDFKDLTFVPDRDRSNTRLAFGSLPQGWEPAKPVVEEPVSKVVLAVSDEVKVSDDLKYGLKELPKEEKTSGKKK